jgi:hypothetical protein
MDRRDGSASELQEYDVTILLKATLLHPSCVLLLASSSFLLACDAAVNNGRTKTNAPFNVCISFVTIYS